MKKKKDYVQINKKNVTLIYVGPSFPDYSLTRYKVISNEIPENFLNKVKNKHALKSLFVSPENLGDAIIQVKLQGHPLNVYYKAIAKELN